jgi:5'-nucleotidase
LIVEDTVPGNIDADAQLDATASPETGGAVIAFTNPGGVRTGIGKDGGGDVSFDKLFACRPFNNMRVTLTLRGAQIKALLEQQSQGRSRILLASHGIYMAGRPAGDHDRLTSSRLTASPWIRRCVIG